MAPHAPASPGARTFEVTTESHLAAGGEAVARAPDGRVIFVRCAAPEERVRIRIDKVSPRFLRAQALVVLAPGPARVEPRCPHYLRCGGCALQHVHPAAQLISKQAALEAALVRIGKVDPSTVDVRPAWSGEPFGYRTRARLSFGANGALGYRAEASREVVDVDVCPVLHPALERVRAAARLVLRDPAARGRGDGELELVTNGEEVSFAVSAGYDRLAELITSREPSARRDAILSAQDEFGPLFLSPRVFAQATREGNRALVAEVGALIEARGGLDEAVELYSGSGNFTRVLAPRTTRTLAIEGAAEAVALARRSALPRVSLVEAPVEEALADLALRPELVLLDPPRAGLSEAALLGLAKLAPEVVTYVSCDPATFARDVERLAAHGLYLDRVRLFDLYPETAHAEVVGRLVRRGSAPG